MAHAESYDPNQDVDIQALYRYQAGIVEPQELAAKNIPQLPDRRPPRKMAGSIALGPITVGALGGFQRGGEARYIDCTENPGDSISLTIDLLEASRYKIGDARAEPGAALDWQKDAYTITSGGEGSFSAVVGGWGPVYSYTELENRDIASYIQNTKTGATQVLEASPTDSLQQQQPVTITYQCGRPG
jgi:hypothetical protein